MVFLMAFKNKKSLELVDRLLEFAEHSFCGGVIERTLRSLRGMKDVPDSIWM